MHVWVLSRCKRRVEERLENVHHYLLKVLVRFAHKDFAEPWNLYHVAHSVCRAACIRVHGSHLVLNKPIRKGMPFRTLSPVDGKARFDRYFVLLVCHTRVRYVPVELCEEFAVHLVRRLHEHCSQVGRPCKGMRRVVNRARVNINWLRAACATDSSELKRSE